MEQNQKVEAIVSGNQILFFGHEDSKVIRRLGQASFYHPRAKHQGAQNQLPDQENLHENWQST